MSSQQRRTRPCESCRGRHLKCDGEGDTSCSNCKKSSQKCVRTTKLFKFKTGAKPKRTLSFSSDQTWVQSSHDQLAFVDETPDELAPAATNTILETNDEEEESSEVVQHSAPDPVNAEQPSLPSYNLLPSPTISNSLLSDSTFHSDAQSNVQNPQRNVHSEDICSNTDAQLMTMLSPLAVLGSTTSPAQTDLAGSTATMEVGVQEACLIRHFIEALAHSFDTTDRDAHFTITVPQRALQSPVLLYAICTASARHLTRIWFRKSPNGVISFNGIRLPELNEDSAIHYHNVCLSLLIEFSNDQTRAAPEDALAAATILRFYEQVDTTLTGLDAETYQNVVHRVMYSQHTEALFTLKSMEQPVKDCNGFPSASSGVRYSACLLALRQEIWSVLLYRRSFRLPISPVLDYSSFTESDDFVWSNRIMLWCADVLRFCFGPDTAVQIAASATGSAFERWDAMKAFEESWPRLQPPCFHPLYQAPADPTCRKFFPTIWHSNDAQVIGMQHLELGRMLLAVYNPRRQRVGIGSSAMAKTVELQLRRSILRLCGLALSNKSFQAGMTTAAIGISIGGEYFQDEGEQKAIVEFLTILDEEHAWPTKAVVGALEAAWGLQKGMERSESLRGPASV